MRKHVFRESLAVFLLTLMGGAVSSLAARAAEPLSKADTAQLQELGTKTFGIKWTGAVHAGQERGVVAVTDGTTTLTRRGLRTFIINDKKRVTDDSKMFAGSDDELKKRGTRILEATGVKASEILEARVLLQTTQSSYLAPGAAAKTEGPQKGRRTLLVTRQVGGIHVPSSRFVLNLDASGRIAFMELTWPELSKETLAAAQRIRDAQREMKPPAVEAATVESAQPVVLHSPAVGFFDDQVAALQVVYRPDRPETGKKPVRYLGIDGKEVTLPRQLELPREEKIERKSPAKPQS